MPKSHAEAWAEVSAKYERAQKHIHDLQSRLEVFRKLNPYCIRRKDDLESGQATYYVASVPELPLDIPLILGDALQNLRSTLDHLVWKMIERGGGKPGTQTGFPIFDDAVGYDTAKSRKVEGLGKVAIEALDRIAPYNGGNHKLWLLHKLNNIDKHRLLLTVCHRPFGHTLTPSEEKEFIRKRGGNIGDAVRYEISYLNRLPAPLQAGDELRTIPISEVNDNVGFMIGIAIDEPGIAKGMPLDLMVGFLSSEVGMVMSDLARFV